MQRALLLVIVTTLVPLLAVQGVIYWAWLQSERDSELQANLEMARAFGVTFETFVRDVVRSEQTVAAALRHVDQDHHDLVQELLQVNHRQYASSIRWDCLDVAGLVRASSVADQDGQPLEGESAWFEVLRNGQTQIVSDLYPKIGDEPSVFFIAVRLQDAAGEFQGAIVAEIGATRFTRLAAPIRRNEAGTLMLFDRHGTLAYTEPHREVEQRQSWRGDPLLQQAMAGQEALGETHVDDVRRYVARVPLAESGWIAGAGRPVAEVLEPIYSSLWRAVGVNLLVIAASLIGAMTISRRIITRLRGLQDHALAIGQGDLSRRSRPTGIEELRSLATALNLMSAELTQARREQQQTQGLLEERVTERTAELATIVSRLESEVRQRARAEQFVREQGRILEAFFHHSMTCLVFLDPRFNFVRVNEAYARACGRAMTDFSGRNYFELFPDGETEALFREVIGSKQPAQAYARPFRFPEHPEWGLTYWDWTIVPIVGDTSEVDFLVFSLNDVTERVRSQHALRESEQRYRSLTWATSQIVWTVNARGEVSDDIPSWRAFTGQSLHEVQGLAWLDAIHPEDRQAAVLRWREAVTQQAACETEYRLRRHDGVYRDMFARGVPVIESDGTLREWVGTCSDVTEQHAAEKELARYRQHLEELVQTRTAELETANRHLHSEIEQRKEAAEVLRHTAEELARSNKELGQFAYIASHDLQEPLRVITGYLQLIESRYRSRLDSEGEEFINFVVEAVERMQQLISDLLEYSRVGSRGRPLQATDAQTVLTRTLAGLKRLIEESQAEITSDPLPTVMADGTQLMQLFQNLIANSIKFHGAQRPAIHIQAQRCDGRWAFSVRDNGIGIERQYFEKIFVIFQRLHTRQKYPGTGIGLAICKKIVERHGGEIWVESTLGEGSTFYFTLPAVAEGD